MKTLMAAILAATVIGGGSWYYFDNIHAVPIGTVLDSPRAYSGKELALRGRVKERFSFLVLHYFSLEDGTGTIPVVTERPLPAIGSDIRITGRLEEGFSLGDRQVLVFIESPE